MNCRRKSSRYVAPLSERTVRLDCVVAVTNAMLGRPSYPELYGTGARNLPLLGHELCEIAPQPYQAPDVDPL